MVGKLDNVLAAAAVVGATTKPAQETQPTQSARVVMKPHEEDEESLFQKDADDIKIERGSVDEETVDFMTKGLNELMEKINCNLEFSYHRFEDVMSVSMVDKETKEVIKEMPPEEMIEGIMKAKIWLGAFIDKTF
ncbi:MAG: flagellar protein FlaG [Selenomonadaceae bacterium]|nr:flagellar protein FlaG [Selenomonadaceae bacterium]